MWRRHDVGPYARLVAQALAFYCERNAWTCHATQRTLMVYTGITGPALRRAIRELEDAGIVSRYQRGRRSPTEYTLTPHIRR